MFSNVGMNPYGPGGSVVTAQPQTPSSPVEPGKENASAARGERAASASAPETTQRVDPAKQTMRAEKVPVQERREDRVPGPAPALPQRAETSLFLSVKERQAEALQPPPDPDAPAGPPPAFQQSPLEAERRASLAADAVQLKPDDTLPASPTRPEAEGEAAEATDLFEADPKSDPAAGLPGATPEAQPQATQARADEAALEAAVRKLVEDAQQIDVPPKPDIKAETNFANIQQMDRQEPAGSVDVTR